MKKIDEVLKLSIDPNISVLVVHLWWQIGRFQFLKPSVSDFLIKSRDVAVIHLPT